MIATKQWTPKVIMRGCKILCMQCKYFKFIDSLNFFPMPLAKLEEAFGIPHAKGYFPHYFNAKSNQQYEDPASNPKYYGYEYMLEKEHPKIYPRL